MEGVVPRKSHLKSARTNPAALLAGNLAKNPFLPDPRQNYLHLSSLEPALQMSKQSVRSATTLAAFVFATFLLSASANDRVWILDPTFHLNRLSTQYVPTFYPSYGLVNSIGSVALQADGKIIVAGGVVSDNGAYRAFARLLPNGEVDPDFQPGRNLAAVSALAVNSQQNIYTVNKTDDFVQSISQYDPTGQSLWSHQLSPRGDFREALLALPDGSILVGGSFTNVGDIQRKYIALISETGVVQTSFAPERNGAVLTLSRQQDIDSDST